jgi:hypothetical protein
MTLRNENIGIAIGIVVLIVGLVLTRRSPGEVEGAVIAVLSLGSALGFSMYLNERDRGRQRSPRS